MLKAKNVRNDEFYTQLKDIEVELSHYDTFLKGKSIYLPCDDPHRSHFFTYFVQHFNRLGLKQLIATCYDASFSQLSLFEDYDEAGNLISRPKKAYKAVIKEVKTEESIQDLVKSRANTLTLLDENGDFASEECVAIMKDVDVVITNPPFSLFRALLHLLNQLDKDYVLLGPSQGVTYSESFQLFQSGRLHLGATPFSSGLEFEVPRGSPFDKEQDGHFYKSVPIAWFTSFGVRPSLQKLQLTQSFDPEHYPKLDGNETVINVDKISEIPKDYRGQMAVPLTFLKFWDKESFELLGKIDKAVVEGQEKFTRLLIQQIKK